MKRYIAVAAIVCGALLALAPIASDFVQGIQLAQAIETTRGVGGTTFMRQPLDETYQVASWLLGGGLIGLGIIGGCRGGADVLPRS